MKKNGYFILIIYLLTILLTGCVSNIWSGALLVYDRHNIYKKLTDYQLAANASRALYHDQLFKQPGCSIDLAVFNRDILMAGTVPTLNLEKEATRRLFALKGYRRLFNQLSLSSEPGNSLTDSWITTKIRSQIFADAEIDPHTFKVITSNSVVYLMGDVRPEQAQRVVSIARNCTGVVRVVKLLKYYNLSGKALPDS